MDFSFSEDHLALGNLARQIFADRCDDQAIQKFAESGAAYDPALWRTLTQAGLVGVGISVRNGGTGLGMIGTAQMLQAAGAALAPVPLLETTMAACALAESDAHHEVVSRAIAGDAILTSACEEVGDVVEYPSCSASRSKDGWVLIGERSAVPFGMEADLLLVSARTEKGPGLFAVPAKSANISRKFQSGPDLIPRAVVRLENVQLPAEAWIGDAVSLERHIGRLQIALSARQLGIAEESLRRTAAYTSERVQFGKPIGTMQAVQQRAADGYMDVEAMRSTLWRAAWLIDQDIYDRSEIATAKYWAAIGGHRVTHTAQHQHGGVGADTTYPIHRYFLAARSVASTLGGAESMLAAIGAAIASGEARRLTAIGGNRDAV
jgi:alkylation response protein AidB-like acyl-CoA dehydrogenase